MVKEITIFEPKPYIWLTTENIAAVQGIKPLSSESNALKDEILIEDEILVEDDSQFVEVPQYNTIMAEKERLRERAKKNDPTTSATTTQALIPAGAIVAALGFLKEFGIVSSDRHRHGLDQYLLGTTEAVVPGYETKIVSGFGLPQQGATANKISIGFTGLRLALERNSLGHGRLDLRVGMRNAGVGVAISVKGERVINPYVRKASWLGRVKKYPNHVSIKISNLSGAVNNINQAAQEIRLTYAQYNQMEQILKKEGEVQAARYLEKECATQIKNPTRLKMVASGLYGILGELAVYIGLGIVIDELAELAGFNPDFTGRNLVQVGSTVGIVRVYGSIKEYLKTRAMPKDAGRAGICSVGEAAITLGVFEAAGAFLDGTCDRIHVKKDFFGRTVTQFFITLVLMYMGKKSFTFECNPPSDDGDGMAASKVAAFESSNDASLISSDSQTEAIKNEPAPPNSSLAPGNAQFPIGATILQPLALTPPLPPLLIR